MLSVPHLGLKKGLQLTCAPLSYSRAYILSFISQHHPKPFPGKKSSFQTAAISMGYKSCIFHLLCGQRRQQITFLSGHWRRYRESHPSPACRIASVRPFPAPGIKQKAYFLQVWRDSRLVNKSITQYIHCMPCKNSYQHLTCVTATRDVFLANTFSNRLTILQGKHPNQF